MGQTLIGAIKQTDGVVLGVELDKGDDLSAVLDQFEVLIDFTRPKVTLDYLATCLSANKANGYWRYESIKEIGTKPYLQV